MSRASILALSLALCASSGAAQVYVPPPAVVPMPANSGNIAVSHAIGRAALRRHRSAAPQHRPPVRQARPGRPQAGPEASPAQTSFRPVAETFAPRLLAQEMGTSAADRARFERMFEDLLAAYRNRLRSAGGPQHDVARAATYLISVSHSVATGVTTLTRPQFDALYAQVRDAFAADPEFQRLSDRERQRLFESFAISGSWIEAGFGVVSRAEDRRAMQQWRAMARRNFETFVGTAPERVRFNDRGMDY